MGREESKEEERGKEVGDTITHTHTHTHTHTQRYVYIYGYMEKRMKGLAGDSRPYNRYKPVLEYVYNNACTLYRNHESNSVSRK